MRDEYGILLATILLMAVPLACGIFCMWFDYKQYELKRMCARKTREYYEYEQRNKTNY